LLPLWLGILSKWDQQRVETRKFESDLVTKAIYEAHSPNEMRDNIHNLLKLDLIKEQRPAVCRLLKARGLEEDTVFCPIKALPSD
jgi:hypothetical protein